MHRHRRLSECGLAERVRVVGVGGGGGLRLRPGGKDAVRGTFMAHSRGGGRTTTTQGSGNGVVDCGNRLTGVVNDGSVVLGLDTGQVDRVALGRAQIGGLGGAVAAAAHETAARSLDQAARHPAQEEELTTSALVLALQLARLCPITYRCTQQHGTDMKITGSGTGDRDHA